MSGYNGWKNYETWVVALWIDNEPGTYEARREMTRAAKEGAETAEGAAHGLADSLKDWVGAELLPDLGASLAADLMGAALDEVDWREIAESYLSEETQ